MKNINYKPSFRGAIHAGDVAAEAATSIDPSPLIADDVDADGPEVSNPANGISEEEPSPAHSSTDEPIPILRRPFVSTSLFFKDLSAAFGWKFLSWLAIDQCLVTGGAYALIMALGLPLFKEMGIGASRQQLYMSIIFSSWAMKPFIGVASDLFPIGGFNKMYIATLAIMVGVIGCSILLGVYKNSESLEALKEGGSVALEHFADVIVLSFAFVSFEASTLDILAEGKYSELMRVYPETGSSIISYKFGWALLGSMITVSLVGPLSDRGYFHVLFWVALALSVTPLYVTLAGWIPEKKRSIHELGMKSMCKCCLFDHGTFQERRAMFIIITISGLCSPIVSAVTTYVDLAIGLVVAALLLLLFAVATYFIFPRSFLKVFIAMMMFSLNYISMGSALGYFYTASKQCVPDGPNFDYTFYITISGILATIVSFLSVILYQNTLSAWKFRHVLIFTTIVGCSSSVIDVVIVKRWNIAIGIPDAVFFLLGNTIFENILGTFWGIASSGLCAKLAPPGLESTVFSYSVGISNFSSMVSSLISSGVIKWSEMKTVGDHCDFQKLPMLIVICQIIVPICISVPAAFLVPNKLQTEHLIDWVAEGWGEKTGGEQNEENRRTPEDARIESHLL